MSTSSKSRGLGAYPAQLARRALARAVKDRTYTVRRGVARGLRRKGGLSFIPQWLRGAPVEHSFLEGLDLTGKTIYDIGAFDGLHALFFARGTGPTGRVVVFEPSRSTFRRLVENLELNDMTQVDAHNVALGDSCELLPLYEHPDQPGLSSLLEPDVTGARAGAPGRPVQVDRLDDFSAEHDLPSPDLIKIDVEGYETEVVRGALGLIERHRPALLIELHSAERESGVAISHGFMAILAERGYRMFHVESRTWLTVDAPNVDGTGHVYFLPSEADVPAALPADEHS